MTDTTTEHTIDLGEWSDDWAGQVVVIRPYLSYAASQRIETARVQMQTEVTGNRAQRRAVAASDSNMQVTATITSMDYATAVVDTCVLSWTLIGYDGQPLPQGTAGLMSDEAPSELLDVVIDAIGEFYEERRPKLKTRSKRNA